MVKCFWLSTDSFRYMTGWMSGHDRYKRRIVAEALKQSENNRELALEMLMNPTAYSTLQVYTHFQFAFGTNYRSMHLEFVGSLTGGSLWLMAHLPTSCFGINDNIWIWFSVHMQACLGGKAGGPVDSIALAELMSMGFDKNKGTHTALSCGFISRV